MTSQTGTILVTGANGGLGSAIVGQILNSESLAKTLHGLYTVRNVQRASAVQKVLQKAPSAEHKYDLVTLDLDSLASVREVAADINKRVAGGSIPPIRALVLCAGWQEYATQTMTDDGFDMAFQSNYLSHFLLTLLLLQSMDTKHGRIVVLGSWSHDTTDKRNKTGPLAKAYVAEKYNQIFKEPMDTESLARGKWSRADENPGDRHTGFRRYGAAKLCEVMMMRELSRRIVRDPKLSSIAVLGVDPGGMPSGIGVRGGFVMQLVFYLVMPWLSPLMSVINPNGPVRTTWKSGGDVVRAAFDTETLGEHPNGIYMDGSQVGDVGPEAKDEIKCRKLWEDSLGFAQVREGDTVLADWR
ncbi:NAD(P)-binding protein [Biscogniauxia sp. FL1348]|nr:NAD(P)-binding protein [Biscogniauxia sp. FL1348]